MTPPAAGRRIAGHSDRTGRWAEALAATWLWLKGYRVLKRRARTPLGEIDLIARKGRILAFVEVKARPDLASGLAAVSLKQRGRIIRAAAYLAAGRSDWAALDQRFDLLVVRPRQLPYHLLNAWSPTDHNS